MLKHKHNEEFLSKPQNLKLVKDLIEQIGMFTKSINLDKPFMMKSNEIKELFL